MYFLFIAVFYAWERVSPVTGISRFSGAVSLAIVIFYALVLEAIQVRDCPPFASLPAVAGPLHIVLPVVAGPVPPSRHEKRSAGWPPSAWLTAGRRPMPMLDHCVAGSPAVCCRPRSTVAAGPAALAAGPVDQRRELPSARH